MDWIEDFLKGRRENSLLRSFRCVEERTDGRVTVDGQKLIDFSSNDYLGLAQHPHLLEEGQRMAERFGTSASASRLMSGDLLIHHLLEEKVASFKGKEKALLFGSGYLANIGVIPAICGRDDIIFSDRANHASIIDGALLSGSKLIRFRHNDLNHLQDLLAKERSSFKRAIIIVETIYSMDGDRPSLKELVELKDRYKTMLMVDEAHATGIFGEKGAGVVEEEGLNEEVDIIMGTFGKALGGYGAYVAASKVMITYLINTARSFIYSTALSPSVTGSNLAAIELVEREPQRRRTLLENTQYFRNLLMKKGIELKGSSQIVPVVIGGSEVAVERARILEENGIFALPIRPPTVPRGEARIRFSLTYHHSQEILKRVVEVL
ncbi:TPA: 8-amino-7-oxononanoate synthase [bacterium]|nr:8-amino-7-oxononanoate synthase [bacterium]